MLDWDNVFPLFESGGKIYRLNLCREKENNVSLIFFSKKLRCVTRVFTSNILISRDAQTVDMGTSTWI